MRLNVEIITSGCVWFGYVVHGIECRMGLGICIMCACKTGPSIASRVSFILVRKRLKRSYGLMCNMGRLGVGFDLQNGLFRVV